jgi:uncharacterized protein
VNVGNERDGSEHEGEMAVQRRAGVDERAKRHPRTMTSGFRRFLEAQHLAIVASMDGDGRLWASMRSGAPGFLRALDERTVEVGGDRHPDDPVERNLAAPSPAGLLAIDLGARQRVRVNGTARVERDGRIVLVTEEVYGNCPQYIQAREVVSVDDAPIEPARAATSLDERQRHWVEGADTFFLATAHPGAGADASHRGGRPGFVHVLDEHRLIFPDYRGNNYFNSLGNITSYPRAGLLVPDFASGAALQLSGAARVLWDDTRLAQFPGAQRLVAIDVERVIELPHATRLGFTYRDASPFLP